MIIPHGVRLAVGFCGRDFIHQFHMGGWYQGKVLFGVLTICSVVGIRCLGEFSTYKVFFEIFVSLISHNRLIWPYL